MREYDTDRLQLCVGNMDCPDDPRGREFQCAVFLGVATGQFDHVGWDGKTYPKPEYGSWGFSVLLWRWGISLSVRGRVLGSYPADDEKVEVA